MTSRSLSPRTLLRAPRLRARALVLGLTTALLAGMLSFGSPATAAAPASSGLATSSVMPLTQRIDPNRDFSSSPCRSRGRVPFICRVTRFPGRPFVVLWGDSHALQYLATVTALAKKRRVNLVSIYSGGCPLSLPAPRSASNPWLTCDRHNVGSFDYVRKLNRHHKVRAILGSWWQHYRHNYRLVKEERRTGRPSGLSDYDEHIATLGAVRSAAFFNQLGRARIRADVLAQTGVPGFTPRDCAAGQEPYQCDLPRAESLPDERGNERFLADRARRLSNTVRVIDPTRVYCSSATCFAHVGGTNTYYDNEHLGKKLTSSTMTRYFSPTFDGLLRKR